MEHALCIVGHSRPCESCFTVNDRLGAAVRARLQTNSATPRSLASAQDTEIPCQHDNFPCYNDLLSRLCCQTVSGNQLRGSWPAMSPSPVLPSQDGDQHGSGGIRSHSFGGRRVLGERGLNTHPDKSPGTVNACWVLVKHHDSLSAGTSTWHNIKHVCTCLSHSLDGACSAWLRRCLHVLKESCSEFWHVWLLTKTSCQHFVLASVCIWCCILQSNHDS